MGSAKEEIKTVVQKTINRMKKALGDGDANAVADNFSENTFLKFPGQEPLKGREAVRKAHEQMFGQGVTGQLKTISLEVSESGDLAYEVGEYQLEAGGNTIDHGNYLTVYKQNGDKWEICDDVISSSIANE
ncbi:MAG: SgcJ/EcaC family oxidoreductase [Balneolaceae bacterium]